MINAYSKEFPVRMHYIQTIFVNPGHDQTAFVFLLYFFMCEEIL